MVFREIIDEIEVSGKGEDLVICDVEDLRSTFRSASLRSGISGWGWWSNSTNGLAFPSCAGLLKLLNSAEPDENVNLAYRMVLECRQEAKDIAELRLRECLP